MSIWIDARVPVVFGAAEEAGPAEALLVAADAEPLPGGAAGHFDPGAAHAVGCACCVSRSPAAEALGRLFQARARGETPFFRQVRVVAGPAGRDAIRAALAGDALVSARYRAGS